MLSFMSYINRLSLFLAVALVFGCVEEETFPDMGLAVSGPIGVAKSSDGDYFYVLNSDFEWIYNSGSILVLQDENDTLEKKAALKVPRLGRDMQVAKDASGSDRMVALFDRPGTDELAKVYQIGLKSAPTLSAVKVWDIDCSPLSVAVADSYDRFFVGCKNGDLYAGVYAAEDGSGGSLKLVRSYGKARRAMYIDTKNNLLLAFPTDLERQTTIDAKELDKFSFVIPQGAQEGQMVEASNEVPDKFEESTRVRRQVANRYIYQFIVYDIAAEEAKGSPYRMIGDLKNPEASWESRWLYFPLDDEVTGADRDVNDEGFYRIYRTNFFKAMANPFGDGEHFFLSHRGSVASSNNILKVSIVGDIKPIDPVDGACNADTHRLDQGKCIPLTSKVLNVEEGIYGASGEVDDLHYTGDFDLGTVNSQRMLFVNHFRDLVFWPADRRRFSVVAKILDGDQQTGKLESGSHLESFYGISVNSRGNGLSCSFYGGTILQLKVQAGRVELVKHIN